MRAGKKFYSPAEVIEPMDACIYRIVGDISVHELSVQRDREMVSKLLNHKFERAFTYIFMKWEKEWKNK